MSFISNKFLKITGIIGIFLPFFIFIIMAISIYYSPWFSFTENWISELAGKSGETPIWSARGFPSAIFNIGIILSGAMGLACAIAIRNIEKLSSHLGKLGATLLIIDMISLILVGIFPLTTGILHHIFSLIFFFTLPLALIFIGLAFRKTSEQKFGTLMITLGIISIYALPFLFIPPPWGSNAIIELIPSFSIALFAILFGIKILNDKFKVKKE